MHTTPGGLKRYVFGRHSLTKLIKTQTPSNELIGPKIYHGWLQHRSAHSESVSWGHHPTTTNLNPKGGGGFLDFDRAYESRSTCALLKSYATLKSCSNPIILKHAPQIMEKAKLFPPIILSTKYTYYKYFVGGETAGECREAIENVHREGMAVALDYSAEGVEEESLSDALADEIIQSITFSSQMNTQLNSRVCQFGVVKVTGLTDTKILELLSRRIEYMSLISKSPDQLVEKWIPQSLRLDDYFLSPKKTPSFQFDSINQDNEEFFNMGVSTQDIEQNINRLVQRMERICSACIDANVPLLIDAEHSNFQAAIDYLAMKMQVHFGKMGGITIDSNQTLPVVYNTYQNYLRDAHDRMLHDHKYLTDHHNLPFGVKLVRGAYKHYENTRAQRLGIQSPIFDGIEYTHDSYNRSVDYAINNIDRVSVYIATHNEHTLQLATHSLSLNSDLPKNTPRVIFSQLYGMGDSLSLALSKSGFNIVKYLPYGPVEEVMPYLSRRVAENGDIFSGTALETRRMAQELTRRLPFYRL